MSSIYYNLVNYITEHLTGLNGSHLKLSDLTTWVEGQHFAEGLVWFVGYVIIVLTLAVVYCYYKQLKEARG